MTSWVEWLSKISDLVRNRRKVMALLLLIAAFCLYAPDSWLQSVSLLNCATKYRDPYIGGAFWFSCVWFLYDLIALIHKIIPKSIRTCHKKKKKTKILVECIDDLPVMARNIIRRFPRDGRHVIKLPLEGEVIFDLIAREIICQIDGMVEQTHLGKYYYFKLNELIQPYVFSRFTKEQFQKSRNETP